MMARRRTPSRHRDRIAPPVSRADFLADEAGDVSTGNGPLRIVLIYPNTYAVGMSSLGFQMVRQGLRDTGFTRVERAFTDPAPARSLEGDRPLADFDILAFSVAFELDYLNMLDLLDRAGVPLFASRRQPRDPLVIAGGVAVAVNRHPIYPFVDVLVHGEGEDILEPLARACRESGRQRRRLYEILTEMPGVEVTTGALRAAGIAASDGLPADLDDRIENGTVESGLRLAAPKPVQAADPRRTPAASRIVTPRAELGLRVLAEIARGCPYRCTFCWLGHNCRDFVPRPADLVLSMCEEACAITHCRSVGLISAAVGAHPQIDAICEGLLARGVQVSFSSLRAEEIRPSMVEALVRSGQRGLTLAPETGGERLRRMAGKSLSNEALLDVVDRAQRAGLEDFKLYFMVGLPTETDAEADEIVSLADGVRRVMRAHARSGGRTGELAINLGVYVPKPNTPLARIETPPLAVVRRRMRRVVQCLAALPNVRVAPESVDLAGAQRLLSMGGLETASLLLSVWQSGGNWRPVVRRAAREKA